MQSYLLKARKIFRPFSFVAAAIGLSSCASSTCRLALERPHTPILARTSIEKIDTATWAQLLLRGPHHTCSGLQLPQLERAEADSLGQYRAVLRRDAAGEGRHLVWLIVQRGARANQGPVGIVEQRGNSLVARAVGVLTLPHGEVSLQYNYGPHRESLWATSRVCREAKALKRSVCHEQLAMLTREGERLVALPELITLHRERVSPVGQGWHHVETERCEITEHFDRLVLAQSFDEHEVQAHRRHAQPRQRRSQTQQRIISLL